MTRTLRNLLLAGLLGATWHTAFAQEESEPTAGIVVSTGLEGGGYWSAGQRLQTAGGGLGLAIENQVSTGSLSNLKVLTDANSPVNLAFAQADALQFYLADRPEAASQLETLASIGEECVFVISSKDSGIKNDGDMQDADRLQLGIKSPNSGIRVTFDYMTSLVPELKNVTVHYGDTVELINDLVHPLSNIEKAVMVVQRPGAHSPEIDMVVSNPDKYRFVKITDKRFTAGNASGESAYRSDKVRPSAVPGAGRVATICVNGLLLANSGKLTAAERSSLDTLVTEHWSQVIAE